MYEGIFECRINSFFVLLCIHCVLIVPYWAVAWQNHTFSLGNQWLQEAITSPPQHTHSLYFSLFLFLHFSPTLSVSSLNRSSLNQRAQLLSSDCLYITATITETAHAVRGRERWLVSTNCCGHCCRRKLMCVHWHTSLFPSSYSFSSSSFSCTQLPRWTLDWRPLGKRGVSFLGELRLESFSGLL